MKKTFKLLSNTMTISSVSEYFPLKIEGIKDDPFDFPQWFFSESKYKKPHFTQQAELFQVLRDGMVHLVEFPSDIYVFDIACRNTLLKDSTILSLCNEMYKRKKINPGRGLVGYQVAKLLELGARYISLLKTHNIFYIRSGRTLIPVYVNCGGFNAVIIDYDVSMLTFDEFRNFKNLRVFL